MPQFLSRPVAHHCRRGARRAQPACRCAGEGRSVGNQLADGNGRHAVQDASRRWCASVSQRVRPTRATCPGSKANAGWSTRARRGQGHVQVSLRRKEQDAGVGEIVFGDGTYEGKTQMTGTMEGQPVNMTQRIPASGSAAARRRQRPSDTSLRGVARILFACRSPRPRNNLSSPSVRARCSISRRKTSSSRPPTTARTCSCNCAPRPRCETRCRYNLVRKLEAFNADGVRRVDVVIVSRNDPVSGLRVFR